MKAKKLSRQHIIKESREGKNIAKARHYLESNGLSRRESWEKVDDIRTKIPNVRGAQCKFLIGVARLYINGELEDSMVVSNLNKTLKYVTSEAHVNEYDENLNGMSAKDLIERFKGVAASDLDAEIEKSNARNLTRNEDYVIIPIDTPEEAVKYRKYTSWCVTRSSNMYNNYTSDGLGRFYFCLRKGFENEPKARGDGCPLDSYGLSMIAVSINMDGSVNTITCRWNHDNGGNDNIMTVEQLEDILGLNFYQTFKPYSREELHAKGVIFFDEVQGLLDSGKKPKDIFDWAGYFYNGFACVQLNRKWNFLDTEGKLLSNVWFDWVGDFNKDGFAKVELNGNWNFLDTEGKIISDKWFNLAGDFYNRVARVKLNEKWNLINTEGKFISDTWFEWIGEFLKGLACVVLNNKYNFINTEGKPISDTWYNSAADFHEGYAIVGLNEKYNFINSEGKLISDTWFDRAWAFQDGFALVELNGKCNYINTEGKLISDTWFDRVWAFQDGFAVVGLNGKCNYINTEGKLLSDTWFNLAADFHEGYAQVRLNGKLCKLDKEGNLYDYFTGELVKKATLQESHKTLYITETQLSEIKKRHKKKKKDCSAMAQVHNKVNAGIMDGITCGGMMEAAEPESNEYKIGSEGGNNEYFHAINESPEVVNVSGYDLSFQSKDSHTFLCIDGYNDVFVSDGPITHGDFVEELLDSGKLPEEVYDIIIDNGIKIPYNNKKTGRYWEEENILSFWKTPLKKADRNNILDVIDALREKLEVDTNTLLIEYWDNTIKSMLVPYAWFFNNTLDIYIDRLRDLRPIDKNRTLFMMKLDNGVWCINRTGSEIEEFSKMNMMAIRENKMLNEGLSSKDYDFKKDFKSILKFMRKEGLKVYPYPKVKLNWEDQDGLFIRTGYYLPDEKTVVIFCKDRHPKDILRSFCHEMIHHMQNLEGKDLNFTTTNVKDDGRLEKIESEAYVKGNIYFRKWTEHKNKKEMLNEGRKNKVVKNDEGEVVPEKCDKCGGEVVLQIHGEPIYLCRKCKKYFGTMPFPENLNEELETEISSDEVDLSSFNIKHNLNPKFWKDGHLDSRIRLKLLDISDDFIDTLNVDWVKPVDTIITGSIANFNWHKDYSDIDLHVLYDFSEIDENTDFVKEYFDSKKKLWNEEHEDLNVYGFPVEVYVQDVNEKHASSGVYSLDKNEWITKPERDKLAKSKINKEYIKEKVAHYVNLIDILKSDYEKANGDEYKIRKTSERAEKLFKKIKSERTNEFDKGKGEISNGNIIFKTLRRMDYIGDLLDLRRKCYDSLNSINEGKLLTENTQSKAKERTLKVIRDFFENSPFLDAELGTEQESKLYIMQILRNFEDVFYHGEIKDSKVRRLEPMIALIALKAGFGSPLVDRKKIDRLREILNYIYIADMKGIINASNISLDTTFEQLENQFGKAIDSESAEEKEVRKKQQFAIRNDYKVVQIKNFKEANKYGNHSCPESKLCYTQGEHTWNNYTNNGRNSAYVILKDGWENIEPVHDDRSNSPYDTYGLSMIFVFVAPNGRIAYSNTRWNHKADYGKFHKTCDQAFNEGEISKLIGVNFEDVFKPANLSSYITVKEIQKKIDNGAKISDYLYISEERFGKRYCTVRLIVEGEHEWAPGYSNIFDKEEKKLLFDDWLYSAYGVMQNRYIVVKADNEHYNIFDPKNGILMFKFWVEQMDYVGANNLLGIKLSGKFNILNLLTGNFISKQWFDNEYINSFYDGLLKVKLNNKENFINEQGKLFSEQWFDEIHGIFYHNNVVSVKLNKKWNFMDKNGKCLSETWFNSVDKWDIHGFRRVKLKEKGFNFFNCETRELISKQWFDKVYAFKANGLAQVVKNGKYNLLRRNGTLVSNDWYDYMGERKGNIFVKKNGKYNIINDNNELLFDEWFASITIITKTLIALYDVNTWSDSHCKLFDKATNQIVGEYDYVSPWKMNGAYYVKKGNRYNIIDGKGKLLSKVWFDKYNDYYKEGKNISIKINNEWYRLDKDGNIIRN